MNAVGVDGCKGGWVACWQDATALSFQVFQTFKDIVDAFPNAILAVDMPIGLPDKIGAGGRGPEGLIRPLLGARKSSVFSIPSRRAVYAPTYQEACEAAFETSQPPRKISKQGFFLLPKICQIDGLLQCDQALRTRIFETHPELVFRTIKGAPLEHSKKTQDGARLRICLLQIAGLNIDTLPKLKGAAPDDSVDAAACFITAKHLTQNQARSFPTQPVLDSFGIPIAIWA